MSTAATTYTAEYMDRVQPGAPPPPGPPPPSQTQTHGPLGNNAILNRETQMRGPISGTHKLFWALKTPEGPLGHCTWGTRGNGTKGAAVAHKTRGAGRTQTKGHRDAGGTVAEQRHRSGHPRPPPRSGHWTCPSITQ